MRLRARCPPASPGCLLSRCLRNQPCSAVRNDQDRLRHHRPMLVFFEVHKIRSARKKKPLPINLRADSKSAVTSSAASRKIDDWCGREEKKRRPTHPALARARRAARIAPCTYTTPPASPKAKLRGRLSFVLRMMGETTQAPEHSSCVSAPRARTA